MGLPCDFVCGDSFSETANVQNKSQADGIPDGWMGLDCGPESQTKFNEVIASAKTIIWNGPPGVFEFENFSACTKSMMDAVVSASGNGACSIVGGGDTASAVKKFGGEAGVTHISTGGGASLELLEGKEL